MTNENPRDVIATATTTVRNGKSSTSLFELYPNCVYTGYYNGNSELYFDGIDFTYTVDMTVGEIEGDWGWMVGDELLFYVYPTNGIELLFDDILYEEYVLDYDNYIYYDPDYDIHFTMGSNTILVVYVAGLNLPEYNNTVISLNDHPYIWSYSSNVISYDTLNFVGGHTQSDLLAGHTYSITANYLENDVYTHSSDVGELEMLKCPTIINISGNNNLIVGESLTLTVTVRERQYNTLLSRGYITVYDGNDVVQSNYLITSNQTSITITPATAGVHNIYAIFTDNGVEYNTSRSNSLSVNVVKRTSVLSVDEDEIYTMSGEINTITGTLTAGGTGISNANITVKNHNNVVLTTLTTGSNGVFSYNYVLDDLNCYNQDLHLSYNGTNTISNSNATVTVLPYDDLIYDLCSTLDNWTVTDSGNSASIATICGVQCVKSPNDDFQRIYWKYPLVRGAMGVLKFRIYSNTSNNAIILGTMKKYNNDHMTNVKSWWYGLGGSRNWSNGPINSQNRHGGTRMSNNTWHTIEFRLNGNVLDTLQDGVSVGTYTIPTQDANNSYFNDFFFLAITGVIHVKDVEYLSDYTADENMLQSIKNAHLSQF